MLSSTSSVVTLSVTTLPPTVKLPSICKSPSAVILPLACRLPLMIGLFTRPTVTVLFVTAVSISFAVPLTVNVSPTLNVSVPVSPAISKLVEMLTLLALVTRPCASTVICGICEVLPYTPAVTAVLSKSTVILLLAMVVVKPTPPETVSVSPPLTVSLVPTSPAIPKLVEIVMLLAAVIRPCASTVNCGISDVLPYTPAVTAVLSRLTVTVLAVTADVKPTPPSTFNVSVSRSIPSVPLSPATFNVVAIEMLLAAVMRPFESTVNCGIFVALPYVPAVTAVLASVSDRSTLALP